MQSNFAVEITLSNVNENYRMLVKAKKENSSDLNYKIITSCRESKLHSYIIASVSPVVTRYIQENPSKNYMKISDDHSYGLNFLFDLVYNTKIIVMESTVESIRKLCHDLGITINIIPIDRLTNAVHSIEV